MQTAMASRKPVLPALSYYLTFIHYFGFSINPKDDVNSRYLSIRVKRLATAAPNSRPEADLKVDQQEQQQQQQLKQQQASNGFGSYYDAQWLASYRCRAKQTLGSLTVHLLGEFLRTSIKFTAITFTTFIAMNHCIVLADYIYQGSKVFLELMLEVRLVITKFSALIFVLSWHFNQSKVRQLIKLVKSTSIYIIGTQSSWRQRRRRSQSSCLMSSQQPVKAAADHTPSLNLNHHGQSPPAPTSSRKITLQRRRNKLAACSAIRQQATCRHLDEDDDDDEEEKEEDDNKAGRDDDDRDGGCKDERGSGSGEEIGESLMININYMDGWIVRWWFMCVCVTILHFSLSELELSKCHHLWQWLDDYSMHKLNNQTISQSTLMFLASFDNYIYTVHVYGTRLIGASIICIVCSLQRENIISLRWHALRLIRAGGSGSRKGSGLDLPTFGCRDGRRCCHQRRKSLDFPRRRRRRSKQHHQAESDSEPAAARSQGDERSIDDDSSSSSESPRSCRSIKSASTNTASLATTTTTACSLIGLGGIETKTAREIEIGGRESAARRRRRRRSSIDRTTFFVLGESDWLRVYENARSSRPSGYLSSTLHGMVRAITGGLGEFTRGAYAIIRGQLCGLHAWVGAHLNIIRRVAKSGNNQIGAAASASAAVDDDDGENSRKEQQLRNIIRSSSPSPLPPQTLDGEPMGRALSEGPIRQLASVLAGATPPTAARAAPNGRPAGAGLTSLHQLASSMMRPDAGGRRCRGHNGAVCGCQRSHHGGSNLARPTPNGTTSAAATTVAFVEQPRNNDEKMVDSNERLRRRIERRRGGPKKPRPSFSRPLNSGRTAVSPLRLINTAHFTGGGHSKSKSTSNLSSNSNSNSNSSSSSSSNAVDRNGIEWELERLASKYELIRTVNARIDSCFGPMLLIQFSFLFLMSCIDVVYFSICFNPNTKTKYIIISGMILLWWPYLLLYKFASDINTESKELLASVRRLARLWLLEHHSKDNPTNHDDGHQAGMAARGAGNKVAPPSHLLLATRYSPLLLSYSHHRGSNTRDTSDATTVSLKKANGLTYRSCCDDDGYVTSLFDTRPTMVTANNRDRRTPLLWAPAGQWPFEPTKRPWWNNHYIRATGVSLNASIASQSGNGSEKPSPSSPFGRRACIINKLDHVFKPTYLSIMGIMTVDKFFLLNFAKIVITASVMIIQFIT